MPAVFIPSERSNATFDPSVGVATVARMALLAQQSKLENQIYQQQIDLHNQLDPLEVQGKQMALEGERIKLDLSKTLGPLEVQAAGTRNKLLDLELQQKPLLFDDQHKLNVTAQALQEQQLELGKAKIEGSDIDNETKKAQLGQLKTMAPFMLDEAKAKILELQTQTQASLSQTELAKQHLELAKQDKDFRELNFTVASWDYMTPSGRQAVKDDIRYAKNPIVQGLDINGNQTDVLKFVEQKSIEVVRNPDKYSPSDVAFAQKTVGALIAQKAGFNTEQLTLDPKTGLPVKTKTSSFPDIGSIFGIKPVGSTPSTQPSSTSKTEVAPTVEGVSNMSYEDYVKSSGGKRKRADQYLGSEVGSRTDGLLWGKGDQLRYNVSDVRAIYPNEHGVSFGEKGTREQLVRDTFEIDKKATLAQIKTNTELVSKYVMSRSGLRSQKYVEKLKDELTKIRDENPNALSDLQKSKFDALVDFFDNQGVK